MGGLGEYYIFLVSILIFEFFSKYGGFVVEMLVFFGCND